MRMLSFWAKRHPWPARILLVISHCLLLGLAWFLGKQLVIGAISVSPLWLYLFLLLFIGACMAYPAGSTALNYTRRKCCDLAVAFSGFMMVICVTVQLHQPSVWHHSVRATVPPADTAFRYPEARRLLLQHKNGEKTSFSRKEKKIIRREFNKQVIRYGKATLTRDTATQQSAGIIILACIAAIGLLALVATLACSLACSGADAAAIVVALLGTAAIIWGLVAVIRGGKKKPKKSSP